MDKNWIKANIDSLPTPGVLPMDKTLVSKQPQDLPATKKPKGII